MGEKEEKKSLEMLKYFDKFTLTDQNAINKLKYISKPWLSIDFVIAVSLAEFVSYERSLWAVRIKKIPLIK